MRNGRCIFLYICGIIVIGILVMLGLSRAKMKLTYIERTIINESGGTYINIAKTDSELVQEFRVPYELLHGISIKIGTSERDNNSEWSVYITEKNSDKVLCETDFNASLMENDSYYLIEWDKNVRLDKTSTYEFHIYSRNVRDITSLAFYKSKEDVLQDMGLYLDGERIDGTLCFCVYGGDYDFWWSGFTIVIFGYLLIIMLKLAVNNKKGIEFRNDSVLQGLLLAGGVFLLLCSFSVSAGGFTDENDNIRGGMVLAKGGVLYKDYVTQHTPMTYYLCAFFALLGAGSVQQFRLSYYILEAVIWGLLYCRHQSFWGKGKMVLLPILEPIFIISILPWQGCQILSDGVQGLCTVILLLEFLRYCEDKTIAWDRSIIISCCLWGSIGAAFVSVYALIWIIAAVVVGECKYWAGEKCSLGKCVRRYYKLVISITVPFIGVVFYFGREHSLECAVKQFYTFNREVYPKYVAGGYGSNLLQPFINAFTYFIAIIADNFQNLIRASATNNMVLQLIIVVTSVSIIISLSIKKKYMQAVVLLLVMCCSATRGYGFHGSAAWYTAIMIISIFIDEIKCLYIKMGFPLCGIIAVFLLSSYVGAVGQNLLYKKSPVSELESRVMAITEEGEGIFIDAYCCDSIYLLYKNRYSVNSVAYMLPWYMDWYEDMTVQQLMENRPRIVVYNPDQITWDFIHYTNYLASVLGENYIQFSDNPEDGWQYSIWIRCN